MAVLVSAPGSRDVRSLEQVGHVTTYVLCRRGDYCDTGLPCLSVVTTRRMDKTQHCTALLVTSSGDGGCKDGGGSGVPLSGAGCRPLAMVVTSSPTLWPVEAPGRLRDGFFDGATDTRRSVTSGERPGR